MKKKYLLYLLIACIVGTVAILWRPNVTHSPSVQITTFEECVAAGNPVMESYPPQCHTPDGKHFVQTVVPER